MKKLSAIVMLVLFAMFVWGMSVSSPTAAAASDEGVLQRPIQDFIDGQGSLGPTTFNSWVDNAFTLDCSVDFAGLENESIKAETGGAVDLGTTFSGTVTERELPDGRTLVHVNLHTKNALTRVFDMTIGDYIFGSTPSEVVDGKYASLGDSRLDLTYITTEEPGAPMPDLYVMIYVGGPEILQVKFEATSRGELNEAFGVPQGTPGMVRNIQAAAFNAPGMWSNHHNTPWTWPAGLVEVKEIGE